VSLSITATILAHGEPESLERVLSCLDAQTHPLKRVLVLDNASPDAPPLKEVAGRHGVELIRAEENLGVGGGHERLIRSALADPSVSHVWVLEHDSFAEPDCLARIVETSETLRREGARVGAVFAHLERNAEEAAGRSVNVDAAPRRDARFTFNGVLFPRATIEEVGFPRADFFVGNEDWEYASRLGRAGLHAYESPRALMLHPTKGNRRFNVRPSVLRSYYSTRNWMRYDIERRPVVGTVRACVFCAASLGSILLRDDRKLVRMAARVTATHDAVRNRMGRREYWFLA